MIVGERFAWGHIPKTGGDAVHTLFHVVIPDLVVWADPTAGGGVSKHRGFTERGPGVAAKPILVLNMRRLPGRQLSFAHHRYRNGTPPDYRPLPMRAPEVVAASSHADRLLRRFTDDGRLTITHWLRMEQLREDFIAFARQLRPVTPEEEHVARTVPTSKQSAPYRHDPTRFFNRAQVEQMYERNPRWAAIERQVYGDLMIDHDVEWTGEGLASLHGG